MSTRDMEIVPAMESALAGRLGRDLYETWFAENARLVCDSGGVTIEAVNGFFQDWLRDNYVRQIKEACRDVLGREVEVRFAVAAGREARGAEGDGHVDEPRGSLDSPRGSLASDRGSLNSPRGSSDEQRQFVVGESNRIAYGCCLAAALRPGETSPLLLHGPTGVGKTMLLQRLAAAARRATGGAVVYLTAEGFACQYVEAVRIKGSGMPSFRAKYRRLRLLIVDDLHFLRDKKQIAGELMQTIDALKRAGAQVALSSNVPPCELRSLGQEFASRLSEGMVCEIRPPEFETRREIVLRLAAQRGLDLPIEAADWVASRFASHVRELSGAVNRLHAAGSALDRPITREFAEEALADLLAGSGRPIRLAEIDDAVCRLCGVESESLHSAGRCRGLNAARTLAMALARRHTRAGLSEIGRYFGVKSHATVVAAQKRLDGWLAENRMLDLSDRRWSTREAIERIENQIRAS